MKSFLLSSWMTKAARLIKDMPGMENQKVVLNRDYCLAAMEEGLTPEKAVETRQLR